MGEVSRFQGDTSRAVKLYVESLRLNQTVGDKEMISFTVHNLGKLAQTHGDLDRAARLYGAAKSSRTDSTVTTSWSLTDHAQCEEDITALRRTLAQETFEPAWAEGLTMNGDDAVADALASPDE